MATKFNFDYNDKLAFFAEWHDIEASYHKKFILNFYPCDNTLELYDRDLNRSFFKRTKIDDIHTDDIFVGNTIRVYSRQLKITDYADCHTRKIIGATQDTTFGMIKPFVIHQMGEIFTEIRKRGLRLCKMRMCSLTRKEVLDLFEKSKGDSYLPFILEELVSGPLIAMELVGENAVDKWLEIMGPEDPLEAKKVAPNSLRALYGRDSRALNGFHGSQNKADAVREAKFFFPREKGQPVPQTVLKLKNTTCCVLKPRAIREGHLGPILTAIHEGHFKVHAMQMFYLTSSNADEYLEVYKGVVSDYRALLVSFLDGPCVAIEIAGENDEIDVHQQFRKYCGPNDPDVARQIRPYTLRARFGCDKHKNAVHCTDLPEDTVLELEYFFKILRD